MQLIDCGISGSAIPLADQSWESLGLTTQWRNIAGILGGDFGPRSIQVKALGEARILESRRHLIVSAPTNAGKSLVGNMVLLDAVRQGGRAVLLEPLRALARERADELQSVQDRLGHTLGLDLQVTLTTGDYRLADEQFTAPPPASGQIVVATPERFDVILRIPEYRDWVKSITAVCVDEAHMISSSRRGPVLEYLITSLLCLPQPPRLVLLSATMGQVDKAQAWLSPCDVVTVQQRHPPLHKSVAILDADEDVETAIAAIAGSALSEIGNAVLIFVYQTRSAELLARALGERLPGEAGVLGPLAYHAQMNAAQRESVRKAYLAGNCRCVVTTTALGMGVNLPATHVVVRDVTFPGEGRLPVTDILQMMGRAGRGNRVGHAVALVRSNDPWNASELVQQLKDEPLPELRSSFAITGSRNRWSEDSTEITSVANLVAAQLARQESGVSHESLRTFFSRSLGGGELAGSIGKALSWLTDTSRLLAFQNEQGLYQPTSLGIAATRSTLPLPMAAGVGQLVRDILQLDTDDSWLSRWSPLDQLTLLECLSDRPQNIRRFSQSMADQVDSWMEAQTGVASVIYRRWIRGDKSSSKADQLLGSLGLAMPSDAARQHGYLAAFRSIILYERGRGVSVDDLERRWLIKNLDGVEEQWRDRLLWLLSALSRILETRCFYFCLKEHCGAGLERIRRVTKIFRTMQIQLFGLQEHLKYCSPLGSVLRSIRRSQGAKIGPATIRRLEAAGITTLSSLAQFNVDQLVALGIRRPAALTIWTYLRRRSQ